MKKIVFSLIAAVVMLHAQTSLFQVADQDGHKVLDVTSNGLVVLNPNITGDTYDDTLMVISNTQIKTFVSGSSNGKGLARSMSVVSASSGKGKQSSLFNLTPNNYFIGHESGSLITSGKKNTFFGYQAGSSNESGNDNIFLGTQSGFGNTFGYNNVYIGNNAGYNVPAGYDNVYIGHETGMSGHGQYNIFIGSKSGRANSGGSLNTFVGMETGFNNTTGQYNSFFGIQSGYNNIDGKYNVFLGSSSGRANQTGSNNVLIGSDAGSYGNGSKNTIVGDQSGQLNTGSNNIFLGYMAGRQEVGSNKLVINNNYGDSTQAIIWGSFSPFKILRFNPLYMGIGTNAVEKLDVNGGIKVGMSYGSNPGTIRWSGSDLQVFKSVNGVPNWYNLLTSVNKSDIVSGATDSEIAELQRSNQELKAENEQLKRDIEMIKAHLKIK